MSPMTEKIIAEIEQLPQRERALIAERILAGFDESNETFDPEVEAAWEKEIARRIEEIDSGRIQCLPWEDVLQRLRANVKP